MNGESAHGRFRLRRQPRSSAATLNAKNLVSLLRHGEIRVVSLVGPPGAGKIRLAQFVADALAASFAHGVVFVDLVPVDKPTLVIQAIAATLSIRDVGCRDIAQSDATALRE